MSAISQGTHRLYFEYQPVGAHEPDCPRQGTGLMEVTRSVQYGIHDQVTEVAYRFACSECGCAVFVTSGQDLGIEYTDSSQIGYGAKPEKAAGMWLHPGPRLTYHDEYGPWDYLVTRDRQRPADPADVAGKVGWELGKRGGIRWRAGAGYTEHGYAEHPAAETFASRTAAVKWIAATLAAASAPGGNGGKP